MNDLHRQLGVPAGASPAQVDVAFDGRPEQRAAWRILRDPLWSAAYAAYPDLEQIVQAGWFDDQVSELPGIDEQIELLCTPTHKLAAGPGVVLIATGAFSPPHRGHVQMLAAARDAVRRAGRTVLGAYLSPGHDDYVSTKYAGAAAIPAAQRLRLCELACAHQDWLMVDPWEARWVGTAINFTDVVVRLQAYLRARHHTGVDVWYGCGADNARFARAFVGGHGCVIVPRAGHHAQAREVMGEPPLARCADRIMLTEPAADADASSRQVRDGRQDMLSGPVRAAYRSWALTRGRAGPVRYALRDDLSWALGRWAGQQDPDTLRAATDMFRSGICDAVRRALGAGTEIVLVDHAQQADRVSARLTAGEQLLNLDVATDATARVHVCRQFALADGQLAALALTARPGQRPLVDQLTRIPAGSYTLVDDDIATGFTASTLTGLLPAGVRIRGRVSLLHESVGDPAGLHDIVDLRDLLLGARDGGLACMLPDGTLIRAPYALPYVNPVSRAKLPAGSEVEFSRAVWTLNEQFHRCSALTVGDADPACRLLLHAAGFADTCTLADVCAWHLRRLQDLPFRRGRAIIGTVADHQGLEPARVIESMLPLTADRGQRRLHSTPGNPLSPRVLGSDGQEQARSVTPASGTGT